MTLKWSARRHLLLRAVSAGQVVRKGTYSRWLGRTVTGVMRALAEDGLVTPGPVNAPWKLSQRGEQRLKQWDTEQPRQGAYACEITGAGG